MSRRLLVVLLTAGAFATASPADAHPLKPCGTARAPGDYAFTVRSDVHCGQARVVMRKYLDWARGCQYTTICAGRFGDWTCRAHPRHVPTLVACRWGRDRINGYRRDPAR